VIGSKRELRSSNKTRSTSYFIFGIADKLHAGLSSDSNYYFRSFVFICVILLCSIYVLTNCRYWLTGLYIPLASGCMLTVGRYRTCTTGT